MMIGMVTSNNKHFILKEHTGVTNPPFGEVLEVDPVTGLLEVDTTFLLGLFNLIFSLSIFYI